MGPPGKRRVLVAVDPIVLEGALATILEGPTVEVVQYHQADHLDLVEPCHAAIVTIELPDEVRPDVVIVLPDTVGPAGPGWITRGDESHPVVIDGVDDVRALLDEHLPR